MPKSRPTRPSKKPAQKGVIGPHNGCELALMLSGEKPLARFSIDHKAPDGFAANEAAFRPYVKRGTVRCFQFKGEEFDRVYYCLPTEEWRVKLLELIDKALEVGVHNFTIYDLHRIDGAMLGYSKADVEFFVARWRRKYRE